MTGNVTTNTGAFINDQQYSSFILTNLHDALLPADMFRNVTDFSSGSTLNIKTVGTRTIQDLSENEAIDYTPIDSNTITMTINEYVGDGFSISDSLREDGEQVERLIMESAMEQTRAIAEDYETKFLKEAATTQVAANPNAINGFNHRVLAQGSNTTLALNDLVDMKLAFDKANVPMGRRILVVDPVVGATLDKLHTTTVSVDRNPTFSGFMDTGFARDHEFVMNLYGWNIITSNRLHRLTASEAVGGGTAAVGTVANVFMSLADDNSKPIMSAWRRTPQAETGRNKELRRDETVVSARYGFGRQRLDTLGVIFTSPTATS